MGPIVWLVEAYRAFNVKIAKQKLLDIKPEQMATAMFGLSVRMLFELGHSKDDIAAMVHSSLEQETPWRG